MMRYIPRPFLFEALLIRGHFTSAYPLDLMSCKKLLVIFKQLRVSLLFSPLARCKACDLLFGTGTCRSLSDKPEFHNVRPLTVHAPRHSTRKDVPAGTFLSSRQ